MLTTPSLLRLVAYLRAWPARVAVRRARESGRSAELARALRHLAGLERWAFPEAARQHYEEAVAILRVLEDPLGLAHTLENLGDVHHDAALATKAEPCYEEAVALYRRDGRADANGSANAVRRLACFRDEVGEIQQADCLWQEAHDLSKSDDEPMGIAEAAAHLALHAHRRGEAQQTGEWLGRAIAAADSSGDPDSLELVAEISTLVENLARATPEQADRLANDLFQANESGDAGALRRIRAHFRLQRPLSRGRLADAMRRRLSKRSAIGPRGGASSLADVQWLVARSCGYMSWHCW